MLLKCALPSKLNMKMLLEEEELKSNFWKDSKNLSENKLKFSEIMVLKAAEYLKTTNLNMKVNWKDRSICSSR